MYANILHQANIYIYIYYGPVVIIQAQVIVLSTWDQYKMADSLQKTFSTAFSWKGSLYMISISLQFVRKGQIESFGSNIGLVPKRQYQSIIWTNVDQDHQHI